MTDDVQDADSTASDSTPNTGPHNSQSSHLWGLCNIVRGTAFTSSCNKKTVAVSVQVELLRWLRVRIDVLMRLGLFNGASTLSLDGGRMSLRCLVSCNHAFLTASSEGDLPTMRKLLASKQASPAMVTEGGITPLCLSIEKGHTEAVELLLSEGADVSEPFGTKRTSPLSWALKHRCPDICRMLISRGANYFDLSIHNWSPIFYLWSQTKRNEDSRSALLITMLRRRADEFPWLHQKIVDREGWGLMHRAAVFGTPADVEALMNSGVDPFQPFWNSGWRVLHNVVDFGVHDNFLILFPAYEREFTLSKAREMPDSGGWTLLHIAIAKRHKEVIQGGHDQIVRTLLRLGADWEAKTKPSWDDSVPQSIRGQACSPIRLALAYGEPRYRELLRAIDDVVCSQDEDEWCDADDQFWYDALEDISG
jgi:ankyrin repeat protein